MASLDYIRTNSDLVIAGGDFAKGDCTGKNQEALLLAEPGDYKQFPSAGVGVFNYLLSNSDSEDLKSSIQKEFEADGMLVSDIQVKANDVTITAVYEED